MPDPAPEPTSADAATEPVPTGGVVASQGFQVNGDGDMLEPTPANGDVLDNVQAPATRSSLGLVPFNSLHSMVVRIFFSLCHFVPFRLVLVCSKSSYSGMQRWT
jgi:hypothetical protein